MNDRITTYINARTRAAKAWEVYANVHRAAINADDQADMALFAMLGMTHRQVGQVTCPHGYENKVRTFSGKVVALRLSRDKDGYVIRATLDQGRSSKRGDLVLTEDQKKALAEYALAVTPSTEEAK